LSTLCTGQIADSARLAVAPDGPCGTRRMSGSGWSGWWSVHRGRAEFRGAQRAGV